MIIQGMVALIGLVGFALIGSTFGRACLRLLGVSPEELQEPRHLLGALGIGWAGISLFLLGLGCARAFHPMAFLLVLSGCALIGAPHCAPALRDWHSVWKTWRQDWSQASRLERWIVWLMGVHAAVSLVATWAPPTFWDALVYHIGLPKLFLWHRQVVGVDGGNLLASSHLAIQLLYALGISVGNELWPAMLHWLFGLLTVASLYWMGRSWWNREVGVWAAGCLYLTPLMNTLGGGPLIDLALMWYSCLALWSLGAWLESDQRRDATLIGLWAGCAAGTKLSGLGIVVLLAGLMGSYGMTRRRLRTAISAPLLALVVGGVVVSPWVMKTVVEHGTPWFFIQTIHRMGRMENVAAGSPLLGQLLALPWSITLNPVAFDGWRFSMGPWLICFVPLLLLCRGDRRLGWILWWGGLMLLGWGVTSPKFTRYLAPIYPVVALTSGYVLWHSASWGRHAQRVLQGVVCAWGMVNAGLLLAQDGGRLPVILGVESRTAYLTRRMDSFPVMDYANRTLPREAVICTMDPRIFYLTRDVWVGDPGYEVWLQLHEQPSLETVLQQFAREGITHLVVNWAYTGRSQQAGPIGRGLEWFQWLWTDGLEQHCRLLYRVGSVALYQLVEVPEVRARSYNQRESLPCDFL